MLDAAFHVLLIDRASMTPGGPPVPTQRDVGHLPDPDDFGEDEWQCH